MPGGPGLRAIAVAVLLAACGHAGPATGLDQGVAYTQSGAVRGVVNPEYVVFQGIPYAQAARWDRATDVPRWAGVRDAGSPGQRCVQDRARDPGFGRSTGEDCLSLNVWSPSGATGRPVLVWIHGGGFANGSGDIYDARRLATRGDIVVVTVNYRLGAPGFLAHPALVGPGGVGNYGFTDQQTALRWVRDNITGFGGDSAKVTIAGESAGAMSVCDHLVAPGSAGLFRAAIMASGPCSAQAPLTTAERVSTEYAAARGCGAAATAAACLRELPAAKLEEPPWFYHLGANGLTGPVIGTPVLPVDPVATIEAGAAAPVPMLIGTTRDEFTLFLALQYLRTGELPGPADYPGLLARTFGRDADAVAEHYPIDDHQNSTVLAYAAAVTDSYFSCVAARLGAGHSRVAPVYSYEFNDPTAPAPEPLRRVPFAVGASHSLDLRYVFDVAGAPPLNPAQQSLSEQMIGYWSGFVVTGTPGFPGAPAWPRLGGADGPRMSFRPGGASVITTFERDHQCGFWAGLR